MDNTIATTPQTIACKACDIDVTADDAFCNACGYPLQGTEQEQKDFMAEKINREFDIAEHQQLMEKGGNSLYWVAGAFGLGVLLTAGTKSKDDPDFAAILIVGLILCGIFVFLGSWSKRKPFAAMVSGISLYAIVIILNLIADPATIFSGIILKIFIIAYLIKGIRAAINHDKMIKEGHLS